jgi:uncharacterized protein YcbX
MPIPLHESFVEKRGLEFDRIWAVFDEAGQALTARKYPALLDVETEIRNHDLFIRYKNETVGTVPTILEANNFKAVKIFSYHASALPTNLAMNEWFSNLLGVRCQLLFQHESSQRSVLEKHGGAYGETVGFADQCPILLTTEASLADLNEKLVHPILMNRFRPNLVVSGTSAWDEDNWKNVKIGECDFKVNQACIRCVLTTIDPVSKIKDPTSEPLRTMASFRKGQKGGVVFGMHFTPITTGQVKVDDELIILE